MTLEAPSGSNNSPQEEGAAFDIFEQLRIDYGIVHIGENEFEVTIDGVKCVGTLTCVLNIAKGEGDGGWGNP